MKRGLRLGLDDALARDGEGPKTCLYEERIETGLEGGLAFRLRGPKTCLYEERIETLSP